jgi:hypothetical protein
MATTRGSKEPAKLERRNVELGPLFTAGVLLLAYGLLRRRALAVALGVGAIWLDQRSRFGRALKERVRALSVQVVEDDRERPGDPAIRRDRTGSPG